MATQAKTFYRDESLFETLSRGPVTFDKERRHGFAKTLRLFVLSVSTSLVWALLLLAVQQGRTLQGAGLVVPGLWGLAIVLTLLLIFRIGQRLVRSARGGFRPPVGIRLDETGLHQASALPDDINLKWEDIRLIRHKGTAHLVRGADKTRQIEISTRLEGHDRVASFLKFAFFLRQEKRSDWNGLLHEVRARLDGAGLHFHYDGERTHTVFIDKTGLRHSSADGLEKDMSWEQLRACVIDTHKDTLRFRDRGSGTAISLPRGTDSDQIIEELIRWALHTAPDFSRTSG